MRTNTAKKIASKIALQKERYKTMGKFTFTQTEIPGVVVIEPQVFGDDRGYFMETYQKDQFAEAGIDKETFIIP